MDKPHALSPKESGKIISKLAKHVSISMKGVNTLAEEICSKLRDGTLSVNMFSQHELHPSATDPAAIDWIFLVDTLNFCFWSPDHSHWTVTHKGKTYSGYFALCAAINRAKDRGQAITDPSYYSTLTTWDIASLLQGDEGSAELSLLEERKSCLHEVGRVLMEKYQGSFVNCVRACNNSAQKLLQLIVTEFPCFRDEAKYGGESVSFYKRAQILVGDIWACFCGKDLGYFIDIDSITMFADYRIALHWTRVLRFSFVLDRVPQVLVHYGVYSYSEELLNKLNSGVLLPSGCEEEIEIRGCSIHAVELVCAKVKEMMKDEINDQIFVNPILIDHFLWDYRRKYAKEMSVIPFHKVRTIFY